MSELLQDVNQSGQSLPPVAVPSSQDTDNTNISTQKDGQGDVINADHNDDGRGEMNRRIEAERKLALLEGKLEMLEGVVTKFQKPANSQSLSQLQEKPQRNVSTEYTQRDAELLRITEADLQEMELTPEGKLQTANIRAERLAAYKREIARKDAETEYKIYDRIKREQNIQTVISQCPELDDSLSPQNHAYMAEYNRLSGSANAVVDAFVLAKAKNPNLFNANLTETLPTRRDVLMQHSVGTTSSSDISPQQDIKKLLTDKDIALANALGNNPNEIAKRKADYLQARGVK